MGELETDFSAFPFKPYSIQKDFMKSLYSFLNKGGVGMFESPTGTGKTLSIISSALQWVVDRKEQMKSETSRVLGNPKDQCVSDDEEPDWMKDFVLAKTNLDPDKNKKNDKKLGFGVRFWVRRNHVEICLMIMRVLYWGKGEEKSEIKVELMMMKMEMVSRLKRKAGGNSSSDDDDEEDGLDEEEEEDFKVYFCSRTHSQLSQFVKELRRTVFATQLNVVSLGSRKNMCINEEVLKLNNSARINERCLELQKNKNSNVSKVKVQADGGRIRRTKASAGCPMLRKHKLQKQFKTEASEQDALDIEDLVLLGNKIGTCPYYGSRKMTPAADLVVLPYQSLLFKSARESLGLKLKNSIIIIDEAHNLADSLTSMYDSRISFSQLEKVHRHLELYFERFRNLLGAGNRRYIQTLMVLTRAFLKVLLGDNDSNLHSLGEKSSEQNVSDSSMAINDFLFLLDIDNINLVKLRHYIKESNIIHKVSGYGAKRVGLERGGDILNDSVSVVEGSTLSGFQAVCQYLRRHLNSVQKEDGFIKYVMLAGEDLFRGFVVEQAHAVVLAGGTLQPIEETRERLFPWLLPDKLHFFHAVIFSGTLTRIMKKKRLFREPRSNDWRGCLSKGIQGNCDKLIRQPSLKAVVGGKVSEGINFSDGMGRCVVMVGLPYPSPSDVELLERVKHIEGLGYSNTSDTPKLGVSNKLANGDAAQAGFSVLKSRVIRHANDYAAILLVDSRYASNPSQMSFSHSANKLPKWIKDRLVSSTQNYGEVHRQLHQFFKFNKGRCNQ
ncbi:hypothetical protein MKW92_041499 [Papaver armeniacum]|nr:hypothetical protein MKW92_041499 [Papaver armeniacum]